MVLPRSSPARQCEVLLQSQLRGTTDSLTRLDLSETRLPTVRTGLASILRTENGGEAGSAPIAGTCVCVSTLSGPVLCCPMPSCQFFFPPSWDTMQAAAPRRPTTFPAHGDAPFKNALCAPFRCHPRGPRPAHRSLTGAAACPLCDPPRRAAISPLLSFKCISIMEPLP